MNAKHQFKYTYNGTDLEVYSPLEVSFEIPATATITQMLNNFEQYLKACGYIFDGKLDIVEDTCPEYLDEITEEEPQGGCMADWDKDEEESSCCGGGCGCEDYKDQKLKEWNEGLKNLEKLIQEKKRERENN